MPARQLKYSTFGCPASLPSHLPPRLPPFPPTPCRPCVTRERWNTLQVSYRVIIITTQCSVHRPWRSQVSALYLITGEEGISVDRFAAGLVNNPGWRSVATPGVAVAQRADLCRRFPPAQVDREVIEPYLPHTFSHLCLVCLLLSNEKKKGFGRVYGLYEYHRIREYLSDLYDRLEATDRLA